MVMVPLDLIFAGTLATRSAFAVAEGTASEVLLPALPPVERVSEPQALSARPAVARPARIRAGRVRAVIEGPSKGYAVGGLGGYPHHFVGMKASCHLWFVYGSRCSNPTEHVVMTDPCQRVEWPPRQRRLGARGPPTPRPSRIGTAK